VQVLTVCASGSSAYTATTSFTTTAAGCSDAYESNNTTGTARVIAANTTLNALISSTTDKDWFQFANTSAAKNIRITLTNLPADYDVRLYRGNTLVASSQNYNTEDETIVYNTSTVSTSYKIRVIGYNGANSTQCYTLSVQISGTAFAMMAGTTVNAKPEVEEGEEEVMEAEQPVLRLFPNPARDQVNIPVPASDTPTTVELLDGMGRIVTGFTQGAITSPTTVQLDVSGHPDGVYMLRVIQGGTNTIQRLVVAH
jgi:hypothetical protein